MKIPQEISDKFIEAFALEELREKLLLLPLCFKKVKALSKEIWLLKRTGWNMIYDIYPEMEGKN